jgi:hypothetical protein
MKRINLNYERDSIEFTEIFEYFVSSWKRGFWLLENILSNNQDLKEKGIFIPEKHGQLDYLILKYEKNLKEYLMNSFSEFNLNVMKGINYTIFQNWLLKGHDLEIVYYNKRMKVAISLLCVDEIVLID